MFFPNLAAEAKEMHMLGFVLGVRLYLGVQKKKKIWSKEACENKVALNVDYCDSNMEQVYENIFNVKYKYIHIL